jgi:hypothetical protein
MDPMFWLALAIKMAITAALVVLASWAAERGGSLIGAMVATLPISAAPSYVFVALDHDAAFIAASALGSLTCNAANVAFCAIYTIVAQSRGLVVSLTAALGSWIVLVVALRSVEWTLAGAVGLNIVVFLIGLPIGRRFRHQAMPPARRRWYDVPLRAGMVAMLVATVVVLSTQVGPTMTGILALFPIVLTSLGLIFQPRIGGPAAATITANAIPGLAGLTVALALVHVTALPAGTFPALGLALAVSIGWNLMILAIRRRGLR